MKKILLSLVVLIFSALTLFYYATSYSGPNLVLFNGDYITVDSVLALTETYLLAPENPDKEAESFLRYMHAKNTILLAADCPAVDVDEFDVDTTGTLHTYSTKAYCACSRKGFEILAEAKDSLNSDFVIYTNGEIIGYIDYF